MNRFIVRVELDNSNPSDYEPLHSKMFEHGFYQTIRGGDNKEYILPRATYHTESNNDKSSVLKTVKAIVSQNKKTAEIIVIDYKSATWEGLDLLK
jgi:hypothetical protein